MGHGAKTTHESVDELSGLGRPAAPSKERDSTGGARQHDTPHDEGDNGNDDEGGGGDGRRRGRIDTSDPAGTTGAELRPGRARRTHRAQAEPQMLGRDGPIEVPAGRAQKGGAGRRETHTAAAGGGGDGRRQRQNRRVGPSGYDGCRAAAGESSTDTPSASRASDAWAGWSDRGARWPRPKGRGGSTRDAHGGGRDGSESTRSQRSAGGGGAETNDVSPRR